MLAVIGVLAASTYSFWGPLIGDVQDAVSNRTATPPDEHDQHVDDDGDGHEHGHAHSTATPTISSSAHRHSGTSACRSAP